MGTCDYCKSDRRHSNTQSEVEYCDKKRIREEMKFFVHFFCLLIVPFAESCVSRDLGWLTSLQEAGHEGCPTSCLAICQASNYARESNCTFNQATGFFFSGSTVTTKACSDCYPVLAAVAAQKERAAPKTQASEERLQRASATTAAAGASAAGAAVTTAGAAATTAAAATSAV